MLAEPLPAGLRERDPWLVIAAARVLAARGSMESALAAYARAGALTEDSDVRDLCRQERQQLAVWLAGARPATTRPAGLLRAATQHGPARFAAAGGDDGPADPAELLAVATAALLAGDPGHAVVLFDRAVALAGADAATAALAGAGAACARMLHGDPTEPLPEQTGPAGEHGDDLDGVLPPALVRLVVGVQAATHGDAATLGVLTDEADADADAWDGALLRLLAGLAGLAGLVSLARPAEPAPPGDRGAAPATGVGAVVAAAEEAFAELEAPVLVHWARCVRLLPAAGPAALADLGREGRALGAPGVVAVVRGLAQRRSGPGPSVPRPQAPPAPRPAVRVRLLGGFDVVVDDEPVDLGTVRPRVRAVVQLLALRAGTFVHRDVLAATLWPDSDLETGRRGVQVAVSTLRGLLQPGYRRQSTLLPRRGDAYALVLPDPGASDVTAFDRHLTRARQARARGDEQGAVDAWREAAALYRGDLLPEQGDAEWVLAERDRLRLAAADALEGLGRTLAGAPGDGWGQGVEALRRALELDPFRDGAWRALAEAHEAAGDLSAAAQVRRRHRRVLAELGVVVDEGVPGVT
jgi:DNA-binding SARP family transcriptional activator